MNPARKEFLKDFPNADLKKIYFDVDLSKTGDIEKTYVYFKVDEDTGYDITSDMFLRHKSWVKLLGLTKTDELYFGLYGEKLLDAKKLADRTRKFIYR